jgi:hypothetical protein
MPSLNSSVQFFLGWGSGCIQAQGRDPPGQVRPIHSVFSVPFTVVLPSKHTVLLTGRRVMGPRTFSVENVTSVSWRETFKINTEEKLTWCVFLIPLTSETITRQVCKLELRCLLNETKRLWLSCAYFTMLFEDSLVQTEPLFVFHQYLYW